MGTYVSVRGWVDCVDGQEALVREIIDRHDDRFYSRGWSTLTGPNGSVCVFYCGTIREDAADWLLNQVRAIAILPPPTDAEDRIRGLFLGPLRCGIGGRGWPVSWSAIRSLGRVR